MRSGVNVRVNICSIYINYISNSLYYFSIRVNTHTHVYNKVHHITALFVTINSTT